MSWEETKAAIIAAWPPGNDAAWDWEDAPGQTVEAIAKTIEDDAVAPIEALAVEVNPVTAVANQDRWERVLGITSPAATTERRRAVLISRLRELGAVVTKSTVQAVLAPLLDMDASRIVLVESSRSQLRTSHTYLWSGSASITTTPTSFKIHVSDDAAVSYAGAQLDLTLTGSLSTLIVTLTAPDNSAVTIGAGSVGRGSVTAGTVRLYFRGLAGAAVGGVRGGDWTVTLSTSTGTSTASAAALFVEGLGRDSTHRDGLGASVYFWGVMVADDEIGPGADLVAARAALQRLRYACRPVALLRRSNGPGKLAAGHYAAIPGDVNALPGAAIPGTG